MSKIERNVVPEIVKKDRLSIPIDNLRGALEEKGYSLDGEIERIDGNSYFRGFLEDGSHFCLSSNSDYTTLFGSKDLKKKIIGDMEKFFNGERAVCKYGIRGKENIEGMVWANGMEKDECLKKHKEMSKNSRDIVDFQML
jgi:hypothetical protein